MILVPFFKPVNQTYNLEIELFKLNKSKNNLSKWRKKIKMKLSFFIVQIKKKRSEK